MLARFRIVGLVLVVVFAVSAVVSASASALQWLLNGRPITTPVTIKSSGTLTLADLAAGTTIECEGSGEGTVGPAANDLEKSIKAENCKFVKQGSCEAEEKHKPNAQPLGLPYLTLLLGLEGNSGTWFDRLRSEKSGSNIGWEVECGVGGILTVTDKCTTPGTTLLAANATGGVTTAFLESETASCTLGNASSGMVFGTPLNKNPAGGTISISDSPNL
jgi:hypothetical protein